MAKIKIGTIVEEKIYRRLKSQAAEQGRPVSGLIEEALEQYTLGRPAQVKARQDAMKRLTQWGDSLALSVSEVNEMLDEDPFE